MAKGLKYLLSMLLLIFGCSKKPKPEPEPSAIRRVSSTICDGEAEVALWGDCTDLHSSVSDGCMESGCYDIRTTTSINLYSQGLTGSIPPEIGNLTNLTDLRLYNNQLLGEIPPEIGNLTNLTRLDLNWNQLTGKIPSEIGNLTNLTRLQLSTNQLTGKIPQQVCDLIESNHLGITGILYGNNLTNTCD